MIVSQNVESFLLIILEQQSIKFTSAGLFFSVNSVIFLPEYLPLHLICRIIIQIKNFQQGFNQGIPTTGMQNNPSYLIISSKTKIYLNCQHISSILVPHLAYLTTCPTTNFFNNLQIMDGEMHTLMEFIQTCVRNSHFM